MSPTLLTILTIGIGGGALLWYWLRMREDRGTSADDYIAQSKAQAKSQLGAYLKRGGRPKR